MPVVERGIIQLPPLRIGEGLLLKRMLASQAEEECGEEDRKEVEAGGGVEAGRRETSVVIKTPSPRRPSQHPHRKSRHR